MVGVSDDVNEYAMALKDTEDKLRRCPKRVRPAQVGGSLGGQVWQRGGLPRPPAQSTEEIWPGLTLPLPAAPAVFLAPPSVLHQ